MSLEQKEDLTTFAERFLIGLNEPQRARLFVSLCGLNLESLRHGRPKVIIPEDPWPLTSELIETKTLQQIQGLFLALRTIPEFSGISGILMQGKNGSYILRSSGTKELCGQDTTEPGLIPASKLKEFIAQSKSIDQKYYKEFSDFSYPLWSQMLLAYFK